jgi:hypothetical protein
MFFMDTGCADEEITKGAGKSGPSFAAEGGVVLFIRFDKL